jgi:flagellar basal-body rod modification protein FlgD
MTVNSVPSAIDPAITTPVTTKASAQTLGSEDFMKLLAVQFQSQDPMKPMDDTAFIAQMAQFTSLSQTQTMTAEMVKLGASQQLSAANAMIGKQVVVDNGSGGTAAGNVTAVQVDSKLGAQIVVGDTAYPISSVLYVEPAPVSATTTTSSSNP